jgi:hypothetical protein
MNTLVLKTAKQWEEFWRPKGLKLYSYHGFGASYPTQHSHPPGFDQELMTDREFRSRCASCGQMGMPLEWFSEGNEVQSKSETTADRRPE